MNIHQVQEFIEESDEFTQFLNEKKEQGEHFFLAHGFTMVDKGTQEPWQIGYYAKESKKIVVFTAGQKVEKGIEDEAFRPEGDVAPLDVTAVKTTLDEAMVQANIIWQEKHKAETITKSIIILQQGKTTPTWRITHITNAFSMLTTLVDASSGKIITSTSDSVMNLGQR